MEEIFRKRHKDEIENKRATQELVLKDKREKEKIHNDYLIKNKELEDNYTIRTKEIDNDFIIQNKKLKRKEKKDEHNFVLKKMEMEELQDIYSDRIFSRITSNFKVMKLSGQDIRKIKKFARKESEELQ